VQCRDLLTQADASRAANDTPASEKMESQFLVSAHLNLVLLDDRAQSTTGEFECCDVPLAARELALQQHGVISLWSSP